MGKVPPNTCRQFFDESETCEKLTSISTFQRVANGPFQGGKNHHPFGFNWHPSEGAGMFCLNLPFARYVWPLLTQSWIIVDPYISPKSGDQNPPVTWTMNSWLVKNGILILWLMKYSLHNWVPYFIPDMTQPTGVKWSLPNKNVWPSRLGFWRLA